MRLFFWLGIVLLAALLALFAVSNRATAAFALWPLPAVVEMPLYLAVLAALLVGFVAGALCAWIAGGRRRREARHRRRHIVALERELAATQAQLPNAVPPPAAQMPARS